MFWVKGEGVFGGSKAVRQKGSLFFCNNIGLYNSSYYYK